jgi:hypothetical protein
VDRYSRHGDCVAWRTAPQGAVPVRLCVDAALF